MELDFWQWVAALGGALLVGLGKGGIPGVGNLTVVLYAFAFGAKPSVGILLPVLMSADVVAVTVYRRHVDWKYLWRLLPWMVVGIIIGWLVMDDLDSEGVAKVIGGIILLMSGIHFFRKWSRRKDPDAPDPVPHSLAFRSGTGILGGFATMVANAAGPVAQLYLASVRLPKLAFIGTAAWCFLLVNWIKVPFFLELGLIDFRSLQVSLSMMPAAVLGALVAPRLVRYLNQDLFERLIWTFILVAGLKLLF